MNSHTTAVKVQGLTKTFGSGPARVEALRGIDLQLARGEFLAVMGPSGSGKSTLLHLIGGLDAPTSGTISIDGDDLGSLSDDRLTLLRRKRFGFIFQAFNLLDVLNAVENVALPLVIDGVAEQEANQRAIEALTMVGIEGRGSHVPGELSGGEQQRLAIARALVTKPLLLLADEPTGNLDSGNSDEIMRLLRNFADEHGQTILMVTHDARNAAMSDRLIELRDGVIVEEHELTAGRAYGEVIKELGPQP